MPAPHSPLHALVVSEVDDPNEPAGQSSGAMDPAGQYAPAGHAPEHADVDRPDAAPNTPAGHGFVEYNVCPVTQKKPGGH